MHIFGYWYVPQNMILCIPA